MFRSQKTPTAGIMRFWKTKPKPAQELAASDQQQRSSFMPGYLRLEQRTLLSATFTTFGTTELVLNDFDVGQNLNFAQQDAVVNGVLRDSFIFTVDSGSFAGNSFNPAFELESVNGGVNNQLEVATAFFDGSAANAQLTIDGLTSTGAFIEFTQTSPDLMFDSLELNNFANDNRDFSLIATGDVTLDNVTVFDSNPADAVTTPSDLNVSVNGNLNLTGLTGNLSADPNADVNLSATGSISMASGAELTSEQDISLSSTNGSITLADISAGDDLQVQAASDIVQGAGTEITSGSDIALTSTNGSITLDDVSATGEVQALAFNNIQQRANSEVVAGSSVNFAAINGSATLADISAGDDLQVLAASNIVQGAGTEITSGADIALASTNGSITLDDVAATGEVQAIAFNDIQQRGNSQVVAGSSVNFAATNGSATLADISAGDDLQVQAASDIVQRVGTEITSGADIALASTNGSITLDDVSATGEVQAIAFNDIQQRANSQVVAGSSVNFVATNGSATLANISATDDVRVQAAGDVQQQADTEIASGSDVILSSTGGSITLDDISAAGEVQALAFNDLQQRTNSQVVAGSSVIFEATNGTATFTNVSAGDELQLVASASIVQEAGAQITSESDITLSSTNGSITLSDVSVAGDFQAFAFNDIQQLANSAIVVETMATFTSTSGNILLTAAPDQTIDIQGHANFTATQIEIGLDGQDAGSPSATNVQLGSVSLNASQAILVEDDATLFSGNSNVDDLFVSSALDIENTAGVSLNATNAQLNSATDIVLGDQAGDSILLGEASLIANNAHLEVDGDLMINGVQPTAGNSQPIALGTNIDQTLYVDASGSVEQTQGDLSAQQIGIEATEHVHLTSVAEVNEAIAISAGGSQLLTDPSLSATLDSLAAVENGEVDASRAQAISVGHRGDAVVTNVTSVTGIDSLTGFNSTDGSISVFADQSISLVQDITAFSLAADPQITLFSASGDATDPAIFFDGGQATVTGPTNFGGVNSNQVFVNFLDDDGFLFDGTTQILTLNPDGTVSQDIVIEYGNLGEAGFRVGIVYDSQNTPLNPIEDLNLFTPSNTVLSEAFEDSLFQNNTVTRALIGGNEGGRETFSKVDDFTAEAVIDHFDNPNVFTDITVRNDQDINLFSGSLTSVDNSLNENVQQLLQAVFDAPKRGELPLPAISVINSIEVRRTFDLPFDSPPPLDQTTSIFEREVAPFESGELRWVQVEIPIDDMEMVGDEVILKQPTLLYPAIDDAAEQTFENVGENETDRIVKQIERSPEAEPGYWFRIFKAYDNRDDELIFYYYKTGEVDSAPVETLNGTDVSPADDALDNNDTDNETPEPDSWEPEPERESSANDSPNYPTDNKPAQSVAASTILMGLIRREAERTGSTSGQNPPDTSSPSSSDATIDDEEFAQTASTESYDRLSRLKRKLKRCL